MHIPSTPPDSGIPLHGILKQYWGFDRFRPGQEEIIRSVMSGKDTLALMPTGGGKSLCYQVPALAGDGLCLVISPLIALMKDQVENLRRKNITAFAIYSGMDRKEVINILRLAAQSNCRLLYVSPERLETTLFREYLPGLPVQLIAVDEAHCISQWGYDFRPSYLRIAALRDELPDVPVLALTASATPAVQEDICEKLRFDQPRIFRRSFERPNLSYSVFRADAKIHKIQEVLAKVPGSSILYCRTRKRTKEISTLLQMQGIPADFYHAGLTNEERSRKQEDWIRNRTRVIVCTNAFGMGIDKPDVRTVIHADVPDCLENYYQEAGRAGRDGKTAFAVLLYDQSDLSALEEMADLRFPSPEEIREIYQSVANYLHLPSGSGEGQYFDFDLSDFLKKFRLPGHSVAYALKALEQEGWLALNEQVFLPPRVEFTVGKDELYAFEKNHPALEACIKTLLRAYGGIFDQPTPVSLKTIAGLLKTDIETAGRQLLQLDQAGIIRYQPQKDTPQILLLRNRIAAGDLYIDITAYNNRKTEFTKRMKQMLAYVNEEACCRSRLIGNYFGDPGVKSCGICDHCLKQKAAKLTEEEFESLYHRIINIVKYEPLHTRDLLSKLPGIRKEKAWKVLEFLQSENKIEMNGTGLVRLK